MKAFKRLMTTGMSAPPIGSTTMFPRIAAAIRIPTMNRAWLWMPEAIAIADPTQINRRIRFRSCWPGTLIGRPGRISWSFPNAMFEPQKLIEPMIAANNDAIITVVSHSPLSPVK